MVVKQLTFDPQILIQAPAIYSIAVINIVVCNFGDTPATVSFYAVPQGKSVPVYDEHGNLISGNPECVFIDQQIIQPHDTIFFNLEKFLLHPGDTIFGRIHDATSKVSVHVSFERY
jgi:hypothetical protein